MRSTFKRALSLVLKHEGGYVNHPKDPGGATNYGVIQRTYDAFRRSSGLPPRSVRQIEMEEVEAIYRGSYWNTVRGDDLPKGVDYVTFDSGVNSGPPRGVKWLQHAVDARRYGSEIDGRIGALTLKGVAASDPVAVVKKMCAKRMSFLRALRHWSTFGRGWTRRVTEVEAEGIALAAPVKTREAEVRSEAKVASSKAKANGTSAVATGAGAGGAEAQVPWESLPAWAPYLLVALTALAVFFFIHKWRVHSARQKAFTAKAREIAAASKKGE